MLNLLIISNNPKAQLIRDFMQPLIKAKIDVVSDFDHGLKDVFEKRPATVFFQEQIAGVAGESVARHIQLLLGSGAPAFVMMHEGNARIRPVKGLFEVIVDLDQSTETLIEDVLSALKRIIGDGWDKVAVPQPPRAAAVRVVSAQVSAAERVAADKLVDEFLSDMETAEKTLPDKNAGRAEESGLELSSSADELASLLINDSRSAEAVRAIDEDQPAVMLPLKRTAAAQRSSKEKPPKTVKGTTAAASKVSAETVGTSDVSGAVSEQDPFEFPVLDAVPPPLPVAPLHRDIAPSARPVGAVSAPQRAIETVVPPPSPADFRVSGSPSTFKEQLPEDILMAFDENYRSRSRLWILLGTTLLVLGSAVAGWYLMQNKPSWLPFGRTSKTAAPSGAALQGADQQTAPARPVLKIVTSSARPAAATAESLPSFVPVQGRDREFSARKPEWERYVDATREIRIYRKEGRIRAIQVMASKGQVVTDSFMQAALQEVAGSSEYTLRSREQKQGILIQRCSIGARTELLVYRKQPSDAISAFVVSLE